jgi:hypothetical protein
MSLPLVGSFLHPCGVQQWEGGRNVADFSLCSLTLRLKIVTICSRFPTFLAMNPEVPQASGIEITSPGETIWNNAALSRRD